MSLLSEIYTIISDLNISAETGYFNGAAPDEYIVVTPMTDTFGLYADNKPQNDIQEARLSLFNKNNYNTIKNRLVKNLLQAGFIITDRRYIGLEQDTEFHHYSIDVMRHYIVKEE